MVIEARRLGVKFVWAYIIGGFAIAISAVFPLFLLARELRLEKSDATLAAADRLDPAGVTRRRHAGHHHLGGCGLTPSRYRQPPLLAAVIEAITPPSLRMSVPVR